MPPDTAIVTSAKSCPDAVDRDRTLRTSWISGLDGTWRNPNLLTTDRGSLSRAFGPDGRALLGTTHLPASSETLRVVLRPCGMLDSFRALYGLGKP